MESIDDGTERETGNRADKENQQMTELEIAPMLRGCTFDGNKGAIVALHEG
jgi:hypothetical protein